MSTTSQSARVLAVLKDGKPHSVPEIHEKVGTMRLNSRVADLRKKGHVIVCERRKGLAGAAAYFYTMVGEGEAIPPITPEQWDAAEVHNGQMRLDTDTIAPRTERERYRIFKVKDGGDPEIVATAKTHADALTGVITMYNEGEFDGYKVGLQDARGRKEKGKWVGKWLVLPWEEKHETS